MTVTEQVKEIVKQRKKEIKKRENKQQTFALDCDVCGSRKVKLDGNDFETWDKELFRKQHEHKIRRYLNRYLRKEAK